LQIATSQADKDSSVPGERALTLNGVEDGMDFEGRTVAFAALLDGLDVHVIPIGYRPEPGR
jgi:hypothetical protein